MELNKKAAYLQGLVDGLGVDESTKEGKIIKAMAALLGEMADAIAAMDEDLTQAYDQINDLSEELEDLEADLYEDEDAEDEDDDATDEDEDAGDDDIASEPFYEVACPACGETVYVSEDDLDAGEANCAHCGVTFEVALEGEEDEAKDAPVQYEVTCPACGKTAVFEEDELLDDAVKIVLESGQASISMIQRRLRVGYARAARLIDIMEQLKVVSGFDGSKPRKLLISSFEEYQQLTGADTEEG